MRRGKLPSGEKRVRKEEGGEEFIGATKEEDMESGKLYKGRKERKMKDGGRRQQQKNEVGRGRK